MWQQTVPRPGTHHLTAERAISLVTPTRSLTPTHTSRWKASSIAASHPRSSAVRPSVGAVRDGERSGREKETGANSTFSKKKATTLCDKPHKVFRSHHQHRQHPVGLSRIPGGPRPRPPGGRGPCGRRCSAAAALAPAAASAPRPLRPPRCPLGRGCDVAGVGERSSVGMTAGFS